ncbi:MAG: hypothetical protein HY425_02270 [Candidatus Levybacteria bacterium]|nr:hypothetical protein [Candidatus Levybacteria bacterium]
MARAERRPGKPSQGAKEDPFSFSQSSQPEGAQPVPILPKRSNTAFERLPSSRKQPNIEIRLAWISGFTSRVIHGVNNVFTENRSGIPKISIDPNRVNASLTLEEIVKKEKQRNDSKSSYLYHALIDSGVAEKLADALFSSIGESDSIPMYWAEPTEPIFIPGKEIEAYAKEDLASEVTAGLLLGMKLLERNIQRLPAQVELERKDWIEIARNNMDVFFQNIVTGYRQGDPNFANLDQIKLNRHRKNIIGILDHEDTRFVAQGAEVHVVFPGQTLESSDFSFGSTLNQGVITKIAAPLEIAFARKLANMDNRMAKPEHEKNAEQILKALLPGGMPEYTALAKLFLESKIPSLFMDCRKNRIQAIRSALKERSKEHMVGMIFAYLLHEDSEETTNLNVNVYPE